VISSASSVVTYTSVYTDSEPDRVFWGVDEELLDEGSQRVIVYRYDGLPMQPVAPPSPDYIPGPEEPQTPPVPQDEDKCEPKFIQPHDPDYMPGPMYPEYIPLEDEHVFSAKERPLPPVVLPTAESPGYVTVSNSEKDLKEYKDDESKDGSVDYPMDGGDNGDDDDGDSSGDDTNDEDEEDEEDEHLASADSAVVVPSSELVASPEGTEAASISLPPEAEVDRLLAMPTPPPSPLNSLSPPSAEERLARLASAQAFIDTVAIALPSPPLPPPLYIPSPVDRMDDIPETEMPPHESRVRYGIRNTWVDPAKAVPKIAPMTLGEVHKIRFQMQQTELVELQETDRRRQVQIVEILRVIGDMRREIGDMQAELLAPREQRRRARQPRLDARVPDHQDASRDSDCHI
nr:hypothetical protein [Tanacetum cinerariifolium]